MRSDPVAAHVKPQVAGADIRSMRVRGGFLVVLVVVLAAVGAWLAVAAWQHRADQRNLKAAMSVARGLPAPEGASSSRECHGDGLVSCWMTPAAPANAAQGIAASIRSLGGHATVRC